MATIRFKRFDKPDEWGNRSPSIGFYTEALHWIFTCLKSLASMPDTHTPNEITISSINDSLHGKGSRHYLNEAVDIRSKNFSTREAKLHFVARMNALLNCHPEDPAKFSVLFENEGAPEEHFHIQVKKGQSFMRF
jgi:hypothetical protein